MMQEQGIIMVRNLGSERIKYQFYMKKYQCSNLVGIVNGLFYYFTIFSCTIYSELMIMG
ncbi:TVG1488917 [Thermoplasma volcanium GSS1]|uniref:TVG1488917 protein n=1 Tax=Thermoplasma volcanium (strain ATCC 51530 / DSM 4299 / JCM 9571 / NBRC 15438 / GSS1) TaxID=273116 RepID=Q978H5_THEVO|nr:TVG1488917 [Thermoplasma volcanium GSS1]